MSFSRHWDPRLEIEWWQITVSPWSCVLCADQMENCPICRENVSGRFRIYLPSRTTCYIYMFYVVKALSWIVYIYYTYSWMWVFMYVFCRCMQALCMAFKQTLCMALFLINKLNNWNLKIMRKISNRRFYNYKTHIKKTLEQKI